jgi:hypothetical protein
MSDKKLPTVKQLANEFSHVIREWLKPTQVAKVNEINRGNGYTDSICATGNYCDSNMAMDKALSNLGVDQAAKDSVLELWNDAWSLAKKNEFRRELSPTDFGTYAFAKSGIEITGFLTSENTIDQYRPYDQDEGDEESSIPEMYGFSVIKSILGVTGWSQSFFLDGRPVLMVLTDEKFKTHKIGPSDKLLVTILSETGEAIMCWHQDNFPLSQEQNPPKILIDVRETDGQSMQHRPHD